ncbi:hypothetical protein V6W11_20050 [Micromonospora profundi]|uniref:hypothetical protein n=1 Tax=Micromonospora profundi TaxID=1420889 RepID=UPI002FEFC909
MSAFWAGVLSSLVGAIIGGAFTAYGAWLQGRSAFRTARAQVELAHERQLSLARNQASHDALNRVSQAINRAERKYDEARAAHDGYHDQRGVRFSEEETLQIRLAFQEIEAIDDLYSTYYPEVFAKELSQTILFHGAFNHRGWKRLIALGSESDDACCRYAERLDYLANICHDLVTWIRHARDEVLMGNNDAQILNEDLTAFLTKRFPQTDEGVTGERQEAESQA